MLRRYYNESLPVIKGEFLSSLITGRPDANEVEYRVASYDLRLGGDIFIVAAASTDAKSFRNNVFEEKDMELVQFAVLNISREIIEKHSFGEVFFHDERIICMILKTRNCCFPSRTEQNSLKPGILLIDVRSIFFVKLFL